MLKTVGKKIDFTPIEVRLMSHVPRHMYCKTPMALSGGRRLGKTVGKEFGIRNSIPVISTIGILVAGIENGKKGIIGILIGMIFQ